MSNSKISALTSATTPLAGTETLPIVQSSTTKQVSVANLTAGRDVTALSILVSGTTGSGYTIGSGGTVTQATSKSTSVTLNRPTGKITMNNAALAASTSVSFLLNNTTITANDIVSICFGAGPGGMEVNYTLSCVTVANGVYIGLRNVTGGSLSDAVVINFAVIKGATS